MSRKECFLVLCVFIVSLSLAAAAQEPQQPPPKQEGPSSPVAIEPIILEGDAIPGLPGATLHGIGDKYAFEGGVAAVWAKVGKGPSDWAVLGIRGGRVETIAADKGLARAPSQASGRVLRIRAISTTGLQSTRVLPSRTRLYVGEGAECGRPFRPSAGEEEAVWSWGKDGLQRLLGPGDTVTFDGKTWTVSCAGLLGANVAGAALMTVSTSSPGRVRGLALYDGRSVQVVGMEDLPLPGRPSTLLKNSSWAYPAFFSEAVLAEDGGVLFRAYMEEKGQKHQGLWYLTPESSVPLLQEQDPYPLEEGIQVKTMAPLWAQSAERYVVWVEGRGRKGYGHDIFIRSDGVWHDLVPDGTLGKEALANVWYLFPSQSPFVFRINYTTTTKVKFVGTWYKTYHWFGLFDGREVVGFVPARGFTAHYIRQLHGEGGFEGCLVGGGTVQEETPGTQYFFFDAKNPKQGFMPPPVVLSEGGLTVRLNGFLGWEAPGVAIVHILGIGPFRPESAVKVQGIYRVRVPLPPVQSAETPAQPEPAPTETTTEEHPPNVSQPKSESPQE